MLKNNVDVVVSVDDTMIEVFLNFIFLIIEDLDIKAFMAIVVASAKKFQIKIPRRMYKEKYSTPLFINKEKTR
jgi:hypothetical protein